MIQLAAKSILSPFDVSEHLCVSQELPEVDVEHVTAGLQHDVVVVAVADSQDVGRHAAAGTRVDEVLHRLDTDDSLYSHTWSFFLFHNRSLHSETPAEVRGHRSGDLGQAGPDKMDIRAETNDYFNY